MHTHPVDEAPRYAAELAVALDLAAQAAELIMAVYNTGDFSVDRKADGSPVTVADQGANDLIVAGLRAAFPDDAVLSEEAPFTDDPTGRRLWMVDPLDGTRDFAGKTGDFAAMIGLCVDQVPVVGVVAAPALQRTWAGVLGHGAFEIGPDGVRRPLTLAPPAVPPRVLASRNHPPPGLVAILDQLDGHSLMRRGSVGLKIGLIAAGEADVYFHPSPGTSLWDCCAPEAILCAMGGAFSTADGAPVAYGAPQHTANPRGLLAGHPALFQQFLALSAT